MSIKQKNKGNITKPCFLTLIRITMVLLSSAILVRYMKVYPKVDRLQIFLAAKKDISTCRNCSSVGFTLAFYNNFDIY